MNLILKKYVLSFLLFTLIAQISLDLLEAQTGVSAPDYTSSVPGYMFPETLEAQEEALKVNPLLQRFHKSRERLSDDKYRPIYHYVNPEGMLNDPNGLSFWNGNWHLFYQAYPPEDPRQHWGHAISKDLIHWRDLPIAIYPDPERAVFSGSALVEEDRVVAMYHGTMAGNMVAVSNDPLLLNWEKVTGNAVIPMEDPSGFPLPYSVFDPSLWKQDDVYYALSAGRSDIGPGKKPVAETYLFRSLDLANWQYMHSFIEDDRFTLIGDDYACPYFWPIGDKHILLFYSHMSGGQYLLGDYDTEKQKFITTNHGKFNHGPSNPAGVHAPSATPDGNGGVITIFNMNPAKPTAGWNQIMTLPMRLTLLNEDQIGINPAGNIESLRYDHVRVEKQTLQANQEIVFDLIMGNAMEFEVEIDPKGAQHIELNVLRSENKEEYTSIVIFPFRGYTGGRNYWRSPGPQPPQQVRESRLSIITSYSSIAPDVQSRAPETASFILERDETIKLRIFIDKSVVEVFANGKQYAAVRVYPERDDSIGFSIRSQGQDSELISIDSWKMKNIWDISLEEWHTKPVWR